MEIILCLLLFFSPAEKKKEIQILPVPFDTVSQSISISKTIAVQPLYNTDSTLDTVYANLDSNKISALKFAKSHDWKLITRQLMAIFEKLD